VLSQEEVESLLNAMDSDGGGVASEKKAAAPEGELEVRKAEIEEMLDKIREAQKQREALGATAGRADARESIRGAEDLFDELDRMAEKIEDDDRRREAAEDLFDEVELGGEDYGPETIRRLARWIFNVYVQNHRLDPGDEAQLETWTKGSVGVDHIGIWEQGGVRFEELFETLGEIGYDGYVTVHQSFEGSMTVADAVRRSAAYLNAKLA